MGEALVKTIFGIRGCGKTVKLRRLTLDVHRLLLINTLNREGFNNGVVFQDISELKKFWLKVYQQNFRLIYSPPHGDLEKTCSEVDMLCKYSLGCGNMTLAIEETNVLFEDLRVPQNFNQVVYAGREPGVELIAVAQTPVGFGSMMRSMTKEAFIFHCHETSHLKIFERLVGKEGVDKIQTLEDFEYLHWSMNNGKTDFEIKKDDPLPNM